MNIHRELINIYCDESCHLERDGEPVMLLGAISCPDDAVKQAHREILDIMRKHRAAWELKWVKVNRPRIAFYKELVGRLREAIRRLNSAIPEEARATIKRYLRVQLERRQKP